MISILIPFSVLGQELDVIYQRSLFNEGREFKPPELRNIDNSSKQKQIISNIEKKVTLYGVVIIGDFKKAIVRVSSSLMGIKGKNKNTFTVKVGDKLGDILVKDIKRESIILSQGGQDNIIPTPLNLFHPNGINFCIFWNRIFILSITIDPLLSINKKSSKAMSSQGIRCCQRERFYKMMDKLLLLQP